jgi:hypothetical protein
MAGFSVMLSAERAAKRAGGERLRYMLGIDALCDPGSGVL